MDAGTFDWLMENGTWPTEWAPHMVFMAHTERMYLGDNNWLKHRFESLKLKKLMHRSRDDGLVRSAQLDQKRHDIVDWPQKERDKFVFTETAVAQRTGNPCASPIVTAQGEDWASVVALQQQDLEATISLIVCHSPISGFGRDSVSLCSFSFAFRIKYSARSGTCLRCRLKLPATSNRPIGTRNLWGKSNPKIERSSCHLCQSAGSTFKKT